MNLELENVYNRMRDCSILFFDTGLMPDSWLVGNIKLKGENYTVLS